MLAATLDRRTKPLGPDMETLLKFRRKAGLLPDGSPKPVKRGPKYALSKNTGACAVCGKEFCVPANTNKSTCSTGCSSIYRSRVWAENPNRISPEGRARILAATLARREIPLGPDMETLLKFRRKAGLLPDGSPKPLTVKKRQIYKPKKVGGTCAVCGTEFMSFPYEKKKCCSVECAVVLRAQNRRGVPLSEEGMKNIRDSAAKNIEALRENMLRVQRDARNHPLCGPFETNHHAKDWRLITPEGTLVEFRNLDFFCRKHFGDEWRQWSRAFHAMINWSQGKGRWKLDEYEGWRVP